MKNGLKTFATTLAFMTAAFAINDNKLGAQNAGPGGFMPQAKATSAAVTDSTVKSGKDSIAVDFKKKTTDEDTTKKRVDTPSELSTEDKARIFSREHDAIGIGIDKGKDMAQYTDEQMIQFYEGICRDSGVVGKVFIGKTYSEGGNTTYSVFVNGTSVGGIMNGNNILSKDGLPKATMAQKGFDNRRRRASLDLTHQ